MIHEKVDSVEITAGQDDNSEIFRTLETICEEFPSKYWRDLEDAPLAERYPAAFVAALEQAGFVSAGVPEEYGGIGLPMGALARIVETIHAAGCNGDTLAEQFALSQLLARHGGDAMRSAVLARIAEGAKLQSLAIWEPASGQDTNKIEATATRAANGFVLNGTKRWVRFADTSDLMLAVARTGDTADKLSLFLIDLAKDRGRLSVTPIEAMNNYGGTQVTFENFAVSADSLVGELDGGLICLKDLEAISGILAAAAAGGCSRFFTRKGVDYANERVVFGNPIGKYQGIQFPLAQSYMESEGAKLLLDLAVALYEAGRECHSEALIARHMAAQAAWETADAAFTTHGGFAFAREYDVERKWREVRLMVNETANALPRFAEEALGLSTH
ncbi:MAG: acyl-CoA dehydrogenase family protein [Variibacter sp.]